MLKKLLKHLNSIAKRAYQEVEAIKIYLNIRELEQELCKNHALLGETMFLQGKDSGFSSHIDPLDPPIASLILKIRTGKNRVLNILEKNNSYLLNIYMYISKQFI